MSTRSTSKKTRTAPKTDTKTAAKPKSRLAGPKPPKARNSTNPAKTVSNSETAQKSKKPVTTATDFDKIPVPMAAAKTVTSPPPQSAVLKKRELIEEVVSRSDIKKKYAKPVIEAMLEVMGETVAKGREMNLPPLGRLKYNRVKETPAARVAITRIRQGKGNNATQASSKETVADAAE